TDRIWVYNNLSYDHPNGHGCFVWDPDNGPTNVLFAHNTLINNRISFYFGSKRSTAEIVNNLGYSLGSAISNGTSKSSIQAHDNLWLAAPTGFVSAEGKDFRLTSASTAIGKGKPVPPFSDDLGNTYRITTDFAGRERGDDVGLDLGAFAYP
ncbi:hypothetical protein J7643_18790, partial [bacterium]|nr:hypothetical protein [bacterium]